MHNWSTDTKLLKNNHAAFNAWKLEQAINFGLNGDKLDKNLLKRYWKKIKIDPARRKFLHLLLWPPKS